jgi:hypothetical protein
LSRRSETETGASLSASLPKKQNNQFGHSTGWQLKSGQPVSRVKLSAGVGNYRAVPAPFLHHASNADGRMDAIHENECQKQ